MEKWLITNKLRYAFFSFPLLSLLVFFHCTRHSWATIARNDIGADIDDVAKGLNHASALPITDIYIKPDWGRIDELNRRVIDFVLYERLNK